MRCVARIEILQKISTKSRPADWSLAPRGSCSSCGPPTDCKHELRHDDFHIVDSSGVTQLLLLQPANNHNSAHDDIYTTGNMHGEPIDDALIARLFHLGQRTGASSFVDSRWLLPTRISWELHFRVVILKWLTDRASLFNCSSYEPIDLSVGVEDGLFAGILHSLLSRVRDWTYCPESIGGWLVASRGFNFHQPSSAPSQRPAYGGTCFSDFTLDQTATVTGYNSESVTGTAQFVASTTPAQAFAHPIDGWALQDESSNSTGTVSIAIDSRSQSLRPNHNELTLPRVETQFLQGQ